jgi:hypothetical protein
MLNSLYGRFGISGKARQKEPYLDGGVVKFRLLPEETRETVSVAVAAYITAYGRNKTIRTSQQIRDYTIKKYGEDRYFYSDTDSIHANLSEEDLDELKDIILIILPIMADGSLKEQQAFSIATSTIGQNRRLKQAKKGTLPYGRSLN